MGKVDIEAVRATQDDIARGGGSRSKCPTIEWKEGSYRLRILPPPGEMKEPWLQVLTSFGVGPSKKTIVPPRQYGIKSDPLSDLIDKLSRKQDKASQNELSRIKPSKRFKMFVIDRDDEEAGPKLMDFNVVVQKELIKFFMSPDWGDLTDPDNGHDIRVTYIPKEKSQTKKFPEWEFTPIPRPSALRPSGMSDEDYQAMLDTDYFALYGIGLPSDPEYIKLVLEGREKEFKGSWSMNRDGTKIVRPSRDDAPAEPSEAAETEDGDASFDVAAGAEVRHADDEIDAERDAAADEAEQAALAEAAAKAKSAATAKPSQSAAAAVRAKLAGKK